VKREPDSLVKEGEELRPDPDTLPLALSSHNDAADRTVRSIVERRKKMVELSTHVAKSSIPVEDMTGEKKLKEKKREERRRKGKRSMIEDIWTLTACD
jgi:hypothetical protein